MKSVGYLLLPVFFLLAAACSENPAPVRPDALPPAASPSPLPAGGSPAVTAAARPDLPAAPTATAGQSSVSGGALLVAWIDSGGQIQLFMQSRRAVVPITKEGGAVDLAVSPDGTAVLYRREAGPGVHEIWLAPVDGSGERKLIAASRPGRPDPEAPDVSVLQYAWLPDGSGFLFNTHQVIAEAQDIRPYEDLHRYSFAAADYETLLPAGTGGVNFAVSPDGLQVAFSRPRSVSLVGADGSGLEADLVAFPQFLSNDETHLAPDLMWEQDSQAFWVIVPPSDPRQVPVLPAVVYRVPAVGGPEPAALRLEGAYLGEEIWLSADLSMAIYTRVLGGLEAEPRELVITRFDGSELQVLSSADRGGYAAAWSPDRPELLIAGPEGGLYRARVVAADVRMAEIRRARGFEGLRWIGEAGYLVWVLEDSGWSLMYGEDGGEEVRLADGQAQPGALDARIIQ